MSKEMRINWYGRTVADKEYVKGGPNNDESKALRGWIKDSRKQIRATASDVPEQGQFLYLLNFDEGFPYYCGVLGPSKDCASPSRTFPFSLHVCLDGADYERNFPLLPIHAADAFKTLAEAQALIARIDDLDEAEAELEGLTVDLPGAGWLAWRSFRKEAKKVAAAKFLEGFHPSGVDGAVRMIARMVEALAPFSSGDLGRPPLIFGMPVRNGLNTTVHQTGLMLWIIQQSMKALDFPPSVILPSPGQPGMITILLEPPRPSDYAFILAAVGDNDRFRSLDAIDPDSSSPAYEEVRTIVDSAESVADLFTSRWKSVARGLA
jgi:hypothetical protein